MHSVAQGESHQEFFSASDLMALSIPLWLFGTEPLRIIWANTAACRVWGATSLEDLASRDITAELSPEIVERVTCYMEAFATTQKPFEEIWTLFPEGKPEAHKVVLSGHQLPDGNIGIRCEAVSLSSMATVHDKSYEAFSEIPVSISIVDPDGNLHYANEAATAVYGAEAACSGNICQRFAAFSDCEEILKSIKDDGIISKICRIVTPYGSRWHEITAQLCKEDLNGKPACIITEVDVSELKEKERKIRYLAHHDLLTGLNNRTYVNSKFPALIREAQEQELRIAILVLDLDNFKLINETMGHSVGDQILKHVAEALQNQTGRSGHIARLDGDEFLILKTFESSAELDYFCQSLIESVSMECRVGGHCSSARASLGVSLCPEHGRNLPTLLRHCELALHDAKDSGRNIHRYFRPDLQQTALAKRDLAKDLERALAHDEFRLFYQPRVDCSTQQVLSVEALMRWEHPERGLVAPGAFISALETTGLIHDAGDWIVQRAGNDQCILADAGFDIPISINISPKQFERADFVPRLNRKLASTGCPANKIEIEITESMLMGEGFDARSVLNDLRHAGFSIAVDDFGTGYSNLAYIQDYPISSLKIDRSFINQIDKESSVVNLILSLCRLVGISAVAEGVETIDQLSWLKMNHCDQYQGFLYSRPIPLDDLHRLLAQAHPLESSGPLPDSINAEVIWA